MKKFSFLLLSLLLSFGVDLFIAWIHQQLWGWFITPITHVQAPSVFILWGLSLFLTSLFPSRRQWQRVDDFIKENEMDATLASVIKSAFDFNVLISMITLFVGWLVHLVA